MHTRLTLALAPLALFALPTSPTRAADPRNLGLDVSHFQGAGGIPQSTWNAIAASGRSFALIKATEGLTGPDDGAMANNLARAAAAGLLTGVYHIPYPENRPTPAGAIQEADHLLSYAGPAIGPGHLRPVLDLEPNSTSLSTPALTDWVLAFVNEIVSVKGPAAAPIIYASPEIAASELDSRVHALDLWLADWQNPADPRTANPPAGATGQFDNWVLWQYNSTASLAGISPVDLDVVHSEYKPLSALIIPEPTTLALSCLTPLPLLARRHPRRRR